MCTYNFQSKRFRIDEDFEDVAMGAIRLVGIVRVTAEQVDILNLSIFSFPETRQGRTSNVWQFIVLVDCVRLHCLSNIRQSVVSTYVLSFRYFLGVRACHTAARVGMLHDARSRIQLYTGDSVTWK
jgi:hypothetical protein